jgi:hypothetical protein
MLPDPLEFRRGAISHFRQVFSPPHNDHIKAITERNHYSLITGQSATGADPCTPYVHAWVKVLTPGVPIRVDPS